MLQIVTTLSWISAVIVMTLGIPQLIKLLTTKNTGKVNFISFWIFHTGILLWLIWSSLGSPLLLSTFVANTVCLVIHSIMLFFLYYYKKEYSQTKKMIGYMGIGAMLAVGATFFVLHWILGEVYTKDAQTTMGLIFPAFTTLAFLPQLIFSIRKNAWKGLSIWMFVLYELNNIVWILFWIFSIIYNISIKGSIGPFVGGLIWQLISFTLFGIQFYFTLRYSMNEKRKKAK
ncbi:PQ-loop domain-containing transporter [Mycoplasma leonicaptivi]|uniref:PQ-loop domain-containing transporter n=1 Tax=Mycoplasma leonicaptivi TaxID=36742 RepID=UPI00047F1F66|nr:PQ-loop domain-containing transporter [Mycoplasma leonicaptivi]